MMLSPDFNPIIRVTPGDYKGTILSTLQPPDDKERDLMVYNIINITAR
jgi:hypothetical protein